MQETFAAIRRATGLRLCIKIFNLQLDDTTEAGMIKLEDRLHTSPFCMAVKQTRNLQCIECDLRRIPGLCQQKKAPFLNTCHAGATEIIIPIVIAGQLCAIAYLGQFRTRKEQPPELPLLSPATQRHLLALAPMIEAYVLQRLRTPRFQKETSPSHRKEVILRFLSANLKQSPSLQSLATHLGLSPTRAAHVVTETTGQSFIALRDQLRLQRAKDLLQSTYFKIAQVATECGFSSSHYFHRFFRKQTGLSPAEFRSQHRIEV